MTSAYTVHRLVFVDASQAALADQLSQAADSTGWRNEFTVPLRKAGDVSNTVVAYWCDWTMTDAQRQALDSALASSSVVPAATAAEKHIYAVTEALPPLSPSQRIVICDCSDGQWTPDAALVAMGLDRLAVNGP